MKISELKSIINEVIEESKKSSSKTSKFYDAVIKSMEAQDVDPEKVVEESVDSAPVKLTQESLKAMIKEVMEESFIKEDVSRDSFITIVWDYDSKNPVAFIVSSNDQEYPSGIVCDILQDEINLILDPEDINVDSPITYDEFLEEYDNPKNPRRMSLKAAPVIGG